MKEVKKELDKIMSEMTELAKTVVKDFNENPTDISGSMIQVHEDSPYLAEKKDRLIKINKKKLDSNT